VKPPATQLRAQTDDQTLFEMVMKNTARHMVDEFKATRKITKKQADKALHILDKVLAKIT